ncbi:hypothetical protein [Streptomyces hyaluromycini]|uniref:hypothetical protein n=1 Tax=Streptomyces hyaluromycini TaxID=1377993 RepID=UPI000B5CE18C|nr:hypothetical protein [Streptomyces hyaluromycini]
MAKLAWRSDVDGFAFNNSWEFDATERAILSALSPTVVPPAVAAVSLVIPEPITLAVLTAIMTAAAQTEMTLGPLPTIGLCGGMAYTSLDYWTVRAALPRGAHDTDLPARTAGAAATLRNLIWQRLMDSLISGGVLQRTLEWSLILNQLPARLGGGPAALLQKTKDEWIILKAHIDAGRPWPVGLVYSGRSVWDQHQVLIYGYEDLGDGTGLLFVYDGNQPHQCGETYDSDIKLDFTGTSLVAKSPSDGPGTIMGFFCSGYSFAAPPSGLAPHYGQFLRWNDDPRTFMVAGGSRLPVADNPELMELGASPEDVRTAGSKLASLVRPRDGVLLRERNSAPVYLYVGGAPFHVPDPTWLERFGGWDAVRVVPDGTLATLTGPPDNGTVLREWSSPQIFVIQGGKRRRIRTNDALVPWGGRTVVRVIPDGAIAAIPEAPPLPLQPAAQGDDMQPGETLDAGQSISSPDGAFTFAYQADGNLVLYRNRDGAPLWASNTPGSSVGVCIMQNDGNLVIYDAGAQPIWATMTQDPGSRLVVQEDGNVVIYRPDNSPAWATNTA